MKGRTFRRAWSVIETQVVLALMAILISGSSMLLATLFRSERSLWAGMEEQSSRARLAVQLRADAHRTVRATCKPESECQLVTAEGEAIQYSADEKGVRRQVRRGEELLHQEAFFFTSAATTFSLDASRELPLLRLRIEPAKEVKQLHTSRPLLIEAALGVSAPVSTNVEVAP